jgi:hypothetical protein
MHTPYPVALKHFPAIRQSLLAKFSDCQLQAGFELALSLKRPDGTLHTSGYTTHRQAAGRVIHSTLARALKHMCDRGEERIAPETLIEFWDDELRQANVPVSETFSLPAHEDALARRTLRKWARDNWITVADIQGVEERLEAVLRYPDGQGGLVERRVTGQLDLLLMDPTGRHATVPDWKDTWKLPPTVRYDEEEDNDAGDDTLSAEGYFQQQFYALLLFIAFPALQSVTLREFYIRRSKPREATLWRDRDLDNLIAYFSARVELFDRIYEEAVVTRRGRIRRRPLTVVHGVSKWGEPSPGGHCSFCPKALDCPTDVDLREFGQFTSDEEAEAGIGLMLRLRRAAKQLERSAETWVDRHGPVRVVDAKRVRLIGYTAAERTERPSLKQVEDAMRAGRDPRDLYRRKTHTRFAEFTPGSDAELGLSDDDVALMFEQAAEEAQRQKGRGRRRAA